MNLWKVLFVIYIDLVEFRIRNRIAQLQEYRRMGITTLKEANDYEKDKANRVSFINVVVQQICGLI